MSIRKLQIFQEDIQPGIDEINKLILNGERSQDRIQNVVLDIYRAGLFNGTKYSGAIIIEDETNPKTFTQKLKYLFSK